MSYVDKILTAMHPKCIYRPCDLAVTLHMESGEVGKILKMLERGGMVEAISTTEYKRKKIYQTKQKRLF